MEKISVGILHLQISLIRLLVLFFTVICITEYAHVSSDLHLLLSEPFTMHDTASNEDRTVYNAYVHKSSFPFAY